MECLLKNLQKQQNMLKGSLPFKKNIQTLRINNLTILIVKNAKFSRYCFHMNQNI